MAAEYVNGNPLSATIIPTYICPSDSGPDSNQLYFTVGQDVRNGKSNYIADRPPYLSVARIVNRRLTVRIQMIDVTFCVRVSDVWDLVDRAVDRSCYAGTIHHPI